MQGDFRLGEWLVQPSLGRVSKEGSTVHLRAKVMDVLVFLAARPGEVVSKDALLDGVWGTEFISESALTRVVSELRQALGDEVDHPQILETIPKRGYRLIAPVLCPDAPLGPVVSGFSRTDESPPQGRTRHGPPEGGHYRLLGRFFDLAFARRRRWRSVALLVLAVAAGALILTWRWTRPAAAPGRAAGPPATKSVAVLPLQNLTGDPQHEWFADGITEELTSALSQISALRVISGISARHYKGTDKTAAEIARELGHLELLLGGSVTRDGDRVRVVVYLDEVASNRRVWTDAYEGLLGDSLKLFNDVARSVAIEIGATVTDEEKARLSTRRAVNPKAYEAYLRGLYFRRRRQAGGCVPAERYFQGDRARFELRRASRCSGVLLWV